MEFSLVDKYISTLLSLYIVTKVRDYRTAVPKERAIPPRRRNSLIALHIRNIYTFNNRFVAIK